MTDINKNTKNSAAEGVVKEPTVTVAPVVEASKTVSSNPALVEWPRDEWGTLANLRKELLLAASNIRGQNDKHELYLKTLTTAAQHALARFADDKAAVQRELEYEQKRLELAASGQNNATRVYARPVE